MLDLVAAFIALTTLLTYVASFIRLPPTIGVMATALVFSLIVQGLSELGYPIPEVEDAEIIRRIDFSGVLMTWFLPRCCSPARTSTFHRAAKVADRPASAPPPGADRHPSSSGWPGLHTFPLFGWRVDFHLLPAVRRADLADRPPRRARHPQSRRRAETAGDHHRRRVAVQRRPRWWCSPSSLGILQLGEAPTVSAGDPLCPGPSAAYFSARCSACCS